MTIRPLTTEDVVALAREQADSGAPMQHDFEVGTTQACAYERAFIERQRELEEHDV